MRDGGRGRCHQCSQIYGDGRSDSGELMPGAPHSTPGLRYTLGSGNTDQIIQGTILNVDESRDEWRYTWTVSE